MKFLVDAMLGKLSRFLRIFGFDTIYANDLIAYYHIDPVPDEKLKLYAEKYDRIIITKDLPFYKNIIKKKAIFLEGKGVYNYLNQLKAKLKLNYNFDIEKTRCSICNTMLKKVENKNSIKKMVKPETFKTYTEFYQCNNPSCNKVFWHGPHIIDINKKIKNEADIQ
jgi:uncharacterized protein with PIN domain